MRLMKRFRRRSNREPDASSTEVAKEPIPIFQVPLAQAAKASRLETTQPLAHDPEPSPITVKLTDEHFVKLYKYWCPAIIIRTIDYLNTYGLNEEGLYRVPGSTDTVKRLRHEFDCLGDVKLDSKTDASLADVQIADIASLLKAFLRELPAPMISPEVVAALEVNLNSLDHVRSTLAAKLLPYEFYCLSLLCDHLCRVNAHSTKNKMDITNLAIVFCSSSNLGIGSNIFTAIIKYEVWQNLRCDNERSTLQMEQADDESVNASGSMTPTSAQIAAAVFK